MLSERLAEARAGQPAVVLLAGPAGIGKTRLVVEAAAHASQMGFTVLRGNCAEPERNLPYAPLLELLQNSQQPRKPGLGKAGPGQLAPELLSLIANPLYSHEAGPGGSPQLEKHRLFQALEHAFIDFAGQAPLLVVVEDAHWSDDASLDFLLYLAPRLHSRPILLLLTYRSEEAGPALRSFLLGVDRTRLAHEMALAPLSRPEVDALLRATFQQQRPVSPEFLEAIYLLTEGNPFFIEEVLKALATAGDIFYQDGVWDRKPMRELRIPRSIQMAVQQRADRLSPAGRQLLTLAALVGRRFEFELLEELTGMEETQLVSVLKELVEAQLIVEETADQFAFRHALTREAVYATLLRRERQKLHRDIGQVLERLYAGELEPHSADLAYHYHLGADWEKALAYSRQAAARAQALYAPREASALLSRALEAAGRLAQPAPPELYRMRGQAYETMGEHDRARDDFEQALRLAQATADPRMAWQALVDMGFVWLAQDNARAGEYFQRALTLARDLDDPSLLAHSLNRLGNWHANSDQPLEARRYHAEALARFESLGSEQGQAETLDLLGMDCTIQGNFFEGFPYYRRAVSLFERLGDRRSLASSLAVMGECGATYFVDGVIVAPIALADGLAYAQRSLEIARQINWPAGQAYALVVVSMVCGSLGRYAEALQYGQEALATAKDIEHHQWMVFARVGLGLAYASLLALATGREHLEQAVALAREINSPLWIGMASGFLASVYVQQGELELAAALAPLAGGETEASFTTLSQELAAAACLELALARGAGAAAEAMAARLMAAVAPPDRPPRQAWQCAPRLVMLQGEALTAAKRYTQAEAMLRTALDAAETYGARPLAWRIQAALGRCYRAQRRFEAAKETFAAGRAMVNALAASVPTDALRQGFVAAAMAQLPDLAPLSPRRAAKRHFGGLTRRERDVAALVGQGRSNRAIAQALVLSERTVEKHISNIFGKLQLETRAQLISWALQNDLSQV